MTVDVDGTRLESSEKTFNSYNYGKIYRWEKTGLGWAIGDCRQNLSMCRVNLDHCTMAPVVDWWRANGGG